MIRNPSIAPGKVPVISLWQPWASLLFWMRESTNTDPCIIEPPMVAEKQYETRGWATTYRRLVVIHAAQKWSREIAEICLDEPFKSVIERHIYPEPVPGLMNAGNVNDLKRLGVLPFGALIGMVQLTGCGRSEAVARQPGFKETNEFAFGNYAPGRFVWRFSEPVACDKPIPYVGRQGWFSVDEGLIP